MTQTHPGTAATDAATTGDDDLAPLVDRAVAQAQRWVEATAAGESRTEARSTGRLAALVHDPDGVEFTMRFVDLVARPEDDAVAARELVRLARPGGREGTVPVPAFLGGIDKALMMAGSVAAPLAPPLVMPLARRRLRQLVGHLVLDAADRPLRKRLAAAKQDGFRLNLNLLGEAVLGEDEARKRFDRTMALVRRPDVDYVSVKASSVCSQLNPWDLEGSADRLVERLLPLYLAAAQRSPQVFLNLDMEEYKDLHLTVEVFRRLMRRPELAGLQAGIVLQAYLPDALAALEEVAAVARERRDAGSAPVKVRIVKGANLAMEQVDAEVHDWPQAPYTTKADVDASYVRLLSAGLRPELDGALRIGVASHNLFDVALAHELAVARGVTAQLDVEMLQGMAPAQARAVRDVVGDLILYTPVVHPGDFDVAVSYLVRRLEENAAPQNYLHALFSPDGETALAGQERRFRDSVREAAQVYADPRRTQDRTADATRHGGDVFVNEPDTDPSLPANRAWARAALAAAPHEVSSPELTAVADVDAVLDRAAAAAPGWAATPAAERARLLRRAADELSLARGELLTTMVHEAGKTPAEADPEISEAIDFATYYADRALELGASDGARFTPHRVVVVTPPWNFPVAIPMGGVLAALAAGSSVVIKPAPQTRACAEVGIAALERAGFPAGVLTLVHTDESDAGRRLVTHPSVDAVVLTGASETARLFRSWRPDLPVLAETSGKNALVVTPSADPDLAVADLLRSAFGHAGQKCSAASLVILVGSAAESERFRRQLVDAVATLQVGWGTDLTTTMGPLQEAPGDKLHRGLTSLEPGETWLVEPTQLDDSGRLWSPGVRDGVRPGSWFHTTECFGPVLGVMHAATLDEAIALQNGTGFGLTGGIHSLDTTEVEHWLARVEVGNAYVNRHITGAIVQRQSFGGWKGSVVGPGAKAGGPNYVAQLGTWVDGDLAALASATPSHPAEAVLRRVGTVLDEADHAWLTAAAGSDEAAWASELSVAHDPTGLRAEANIFRYRSLPTMAVRVEAGALDRDVARVVLGAARTGTELVLSADDAGSAVLRAASGLPGVSVRTEDAAAFAGRVEAGERLRLLTAPGASAPAELDRAVVEAGASLLTAVPLADGRRELLTLLREQAISRTLHRFGHISEA